MLRTMTVGLLIVATLGLSACGGREHPRDGDGGRYEHRDHEHDGEHH